MSREVNRYKKSVINDVCEILENVEYAAVEFEVFDTIKDRYLEAERELRLRFRRTRELNVFQYYEKQTALLKQYKRFKELSAGDWEKKKRITENF